MTEQAADFRHCTVSCDHCGKRNRVPAVGPGIACCGNCHDPLAWIAEANDHTFAEVAEHASVPVLVDLRAASCSPCDRVSSALEQVAHEMAGRVKLVKVDIARAPKTRARFCAQAVPALLLMRGELVIDRRTGAAPTAALRAWAERALSRSPADARVSGASLEGQAGQFHA